MINTKVRKVHIPLNSELSKNIAKAYYFDAYQLGTAHAGRSALQIWLTHIEQTPLWMDWLMKIRNNIAGLVGLKNLGAFSCSTHKHIQDYKVGDKIGIFTLEALSEEEIILGENDKHLAVKISVYLDNSSEQRVVVYYPCA